MADSLTLYTNPMSRGRIAHWMLKEVGVPFEVVYLNYGEPMKSDEYLAINPMGKVPAVVHGDQVVTEGAAICAYLAEAFPQADLAPTESERARYYRWLLFAAGPVEQAVTNRALGVQTPEDRESMVGYGKFERVLEVLETACQQSDYIAGDRFTAADVYVGAQIGWGMQSGSIDKRPAFESYWARLCEREAYKQANAADDAAMPEGAGNG